MIFIVSEELKTAKSSRKKMFSSLHSVSRPTPGSSHKIKDSLEYLPEDKIDLDYDFNIDDMLLVCDECKKVCDVINSCDFCEIKLCDDCADNSDRLFFDCETCGVKWCKIDTGHYDDYCSSNKRKRPGCIDCGN